MEPIRNLEILLVDDDEVDRMAVRRAFSDIGFQPTIVEASNGEEALAILEGKAEQGSPNSPYLILLDINMPKMGGHEFLAKLRAKADPVVRDAVVFVLSTSSAKSDVEMAYSRNIAGYLVKSNYEDGLRPVVDMLRTFGNVVRLP